jgi:hypothetical protein
MRIYTDKELIKSRARLGRRASLIGLLILLAGFVISLFTRIQYGFYISLACLVIGFAVSNIGVYNANQWVREPRADQTLTQGLKGLSNKYALYNYTWVVPHVLLTPQGVGVFLVKAQEGKITYMNGRWRQAFSFRRVFNFFGAEPLADPGKDLQAYENTARKALGVHLPGVDVPIRSAVVFTSPKAELQLQNPPVTVLTPKQLKGWMKGWPDEEILTSDQRRTLAKAMSGRLAEEEAEETPEESYTSSGRSRRRKS